MNQNGVESFFRWIMLKESSKPFSKPVSQQGTDKIERIRARQIITSAIVGDNVKDSRDMNKLSKRLNVASKTMENALKRRKKMVWNGVTVFPKSICLRNVFGKRHVHDVLQPQMTQMSQMFKVSSL